MSIKKYTNFEKINQKATNEGNFIEDKDFKIVSKGEVEEADFGECAYDVMEVSVYDINNNVLPQISGNIVAYIKTGDIKNYLYNVTNAGGQKELAIDIEKLLNNLGFHNGILRVNINFVRSRVGNENEMRRVWIQEISPSRKELRILPLKTADAKVNELNKKDLDNLSNLNKDFKYYKRTILDLIHSFENTALDIINSSLETQFGKDFFSIIKNDFGIKDFNIFRTKIYSDFKESVTYYLENKNYDIRESNYGRQTHIRFINCDQYDFSIIVAEMEKILFNCIEYNSYFLKRRSIQIVETPKEFQIVELTKNTQNNLNAFGTPTKPGTYVYPAPANPPIIVPKQIILPKTPGVFEYNVKNTNSGKSIIVKFVNAAGSTMQKYIEPGKSITICALEGTVSSDNIQKTSVADDIESTIFSRTTGLSDTAWQVTKLNICNHVDISETAPVPVPPIKTTPPVVIVQTPPVVTVTPTPPRVTTTPTTSTGGCFIEGTLVTLANGAKIAIEEVVVGMEVLTWNEENGQQEAGIVTDLIRPISSDIISIDFGNESIECTSDHPLFIIGKGWASYNPAKTKEVHKMEVAELVYGDLVLNTSDETIEIHSISPIMTLVPIQTYNLSIEGNHTYYANGILVHNKMDSSMIGGSGAGSDIGSVFTGTEVGNNDTINLNTVAPTRNTTTSLTRDNG